MADLTKDKSILLDKLISDCITFGLHVKEALEYIRGECPPNGIGDRTYFRRRKKLLSDKSRDSWFSQFTRIGFVELHKKVMESLEKSYDDTMHQLLIEQRKNPRNEIVILKLKGDQRKTGLMLSQMSLGTHVIAGVKAKLDKSEQGLEFHFKRSL
jgi:hypothetical protein